MFEKLPLLKQKDEREPFYPLAHLALQRALTRSQQLAFQPSGSLNVEDGKWLVLFNIWLECLLFDCALSDSNLAMGDKVHTLFIEAVAIGYTIESKFPIESFPQVTEVIGRYLKQFGERKVYDDSNPDSWANSAVGLHTLRTQEKLGLDPRSADFEILANDIRSHVFDTLRSHLYDDFLAQVARPRVN